MSLIQIQNLSFSYEASVDAVFTNVSFQMDTRWRLGLIGRNGRGKTTLLRILSGALPYEGNVTGADSFALFPYETNLRNTAQELLASKAPRAEEWQLLREMSLLGVAEDCAYRPMESLSQGELTKLQLAVLFLREDAFILLDEPTNHLDAGGRGLLTSYLRGKQGFLVVSHDRDFLDGCIDHVLSIEKTGTVLQNGNFSTWQQNKEYAQQNEQMQNERLEKEIRRMKQAARQAADWSGKAESAKFATKNSGLRPDRGYMGHKAAKLMKRSVQLTKRREAAIEEKSALLQNVETADPLKLSPLRFHSERIAELSGVTVRYASRSVCEDISFTISRGDRIALTGANGSGKSSLLKLLLGQDIPHSGTVYVASGVKISYVQQDASFLSGTLAEYAAQQNVNFTLLLSILRKLDFPRAQLEKNMAAYSAGQKKKVLLARSLCESAHLYIWDEPLNFVDVLSRVQLEQLLRQYVPTMIFVEHDAAFCRNIATREIRLR